ncbi:MAG: aminotransferase class V-fold PLP-dependent enzyme [Planctomycetota bacterium]
MTEPAREPEPKELWIPGPTRVRDEVLDALTEPMVGHRTQAMRATISALDPHLHELFGADEAAHRVAVHSCTATGLMEMSLRGVGPRVLSLVGGAFSERFARIAASIGRDVHRVPSQLGEPLDLEAARTVLEREGPFDAITVCLSETSTGALTPPAAVADAFEDRGDAALLVDAVTYAGAAAIDASANGLDFVFSGTQKALALPPGLGLYAVSRAMLDRARSIEDRGTFLDVVGITESHAEAKPPMTPTIPLLRALRLQLETIEEGSVELTLTDEPAPELASLTGWERRYRRHARMRAIVREALDSLGLTVLGGAQHDATSPTVTCVDVGGRDVEALLAKLAGDGFTVAPGYGDLRARTIRIGHMGDHSIPRLRALLASLERALS